MKWSEIYTTEQELIDDMMKTKSDVNTVPYHQLVRGYEYVESFKRYYQKNGCLTERQLRQLKRLAENIKNNVKTFSK